MKEVALKYIEQKWEGLEAWAGSEESFWVRLDFLLEYYLSKNVLLSKKFKGQLNDQNKAKVYYETLFQKFMEITFNGKKFDMEDYLNWQRNNKLEVEKAISIIQS